MEREISPGDAGAFSNFDCSVEDGYSNYDFAEKVRSRLEAVGIGGRPRPRLAPKHTSIFPDMEPGAIFDGRLPTVIRDLSLDQLSALNSLFASWHGYLRAQTNLVAAQRSEAKKTKEFIWSLVRQQRKFDRDTGRKRTDQAMSDIARTDIRFVKADSNYEELNAVYDALQAMLDVCSQDMKVISREVTIKQIELETGHHQRGFASRVNPDTFGSYGRYSDEENSGGEETNNIPSKVKGGTGRKASGGPIKRGR